MTKEQFEQFEKKMGISFDNYLRAEAVYAIVESMMKQYHDERSNATHEEDIVYLEAIDKEIEKLPDWFVNAFCKVFDPNLVSKAKQRQETLLKMMG